MASKFGSQVFFRFYRDSYNIPETSVLKVAIAAKYLRKAPACKSGGDLSEINQDCGNRVVFNNSISRGAESSQRRQWM